MPRGLFTEFYGISNLIDSNVDWGLGLVHEKIEVWTGLNELGTIASSPVGLISSMDRALRPVIAKQWRIQRRGPVGGAPYI